MASSSICTACRQAFRQQVRQLRQPQAPYQSRAAAAHLRTPNPFRSLSTSPSLSVIQMTEGDSPTRTIAKELRKRASSVTETYIAYGVCENLIKECARQADYTIPQAHEKNIDIPKTKDGEDLGVGTGWWYETLGLTPTFNTWAQITFLHMYLLTVRLRSFPATHAPTWHQHLLDHFFFIAEDRMVVTHNISARSIRNKYLKDLFVQWRGLLAGYDEGLVRGDAVLATAVWRNVFQAREEVDFRGVGEVVSYVRGVLRGLDEMGDEAVAEGEVVFGDPGTEREGVLVKSALMDAHGGLAGGTEEVGREAKAAL